MNSNIYKSINVLSLFVLGALIMQSCKEEPTANKGNTIFMDFQRRIVTISDSAKRQKAADDFIKRVKTSTYPIFENDTTVVLLYQGIWIVWAFWAIWECGQKPYP